MVFGFGRERGFFVRLFGVWLVVVVGLVSVGAVARPVEAQGKPHVLLISMDGVRPDYITEADKHGMKLPVLRRFMVDGTYAEGVVGVYPTMTYPSHTSLITGVPPAEHGVYNNSKFQPMTEPGKAEKVTYHLASEVKAESLWQAAKEAGLTTASLSWPVTGASPYIDWNMTGKACDKDVPPGSSAEVAAGDMDVHRAAWAVELIRKHAPNFMTVHLGMVDEEEHAHGPFSAEAEKALEAIDGEIGEIVKAELAVDPKAVVFVVSDHGFMKTDYVVNLRRLLIDAGLMQVRTANGKMEVTSWDASVWTTGGSAMMMLRDPKDKAVYDRTLAVLQKAAAAKGSPIKRVLVRDEFVPKGGNPGASFWVELREGYKNGHELDAPYVGDAKATGTHGYLPDEETQVRASFFAVGAGIAKGRDLGVVKMLQVAPTVAGVLGVRMPGAKAAALDVR